jgi:hypothetical protein
MIFLDFEFLTENKVIKATKQNGLGMNLGIFSESEHFGVLSGQMLDVLKRVHHSFKFAQKRLGAWQPVPIQHYG